MRISYPLSLVIWVSAAAAWSQDVPPPLPTPAIAPALPPASSDAAPGTAAPVAPSQPVQGPYYLPPGATPPPGAVMVVPGQPYPYYPSPNPYGGPMVVSPPMAVLVPAPPMPSYESQRQRSKPFSWSEVPVAAYLWATPITIRHPPT